MSRLERALLATFCAVVFPPRAYSGAQLYEPLADSIRSTMSSAIRNRDAPVLQFQRTEDAYRWLFAMSQRLSNRIPDRDVRLRLLRTVHYEATRAGLDPQLVLSMIEVESSFRKYAVSRAGARGYMQVMPFWRQQIGRISDNLFQTRTNLRYGCVIFRHYLDIEKGDHERALGRYNGSRDGKAYPNRVVSAWRQRWRYEGPTH